MQQELVEFEKEEEERRVKEIVENDDDELVLAELRPKSTPEKVNILYWRYFLVLFRKLLI